MLDRRYNWTGTSPTPAHETNIDRARRKCVDEDDERYLRVLWHAPQRTVRRPRSYARRLLQQPNTTCVSAPNGVPKCRHERNLQYAEIGWKIFYRLRDRRWLTDCL